MLLVLQILSLYGDSVHEKGSVAQKSQYLVKSLPPWLPGCAQQTVVMQRNYDSPSVMLKD